MTEYAGVLVLVALIVAAVFGTSINETVASTVGTKVCEITGGDGCGGGDGDGDGGQNQADGPKGDGGNPGKPDVDPDDSGKGQPANDNGGENGGDENLSADEIAYNKSKSDLDKALKDYNVTKKDLKKAAEELIKIAGEETGITDALKCITEGDGSACTETVINALLMAAGGMPLKLAKKYLLNPKKAWQVGKSVVKNGSKVAKGLKDLYGQSKKIKKLKKETADLKKKADAAKKKRVACKSKHSFLPGTSVVMADGSRIPIESVDLGDRVVATDPSTGVTAARPVTRTITTHDDKHFTRLTIAGAGSSVDTLTATDTHPFWLPAEKRWVDAGDITAGDHLRTADGGYHPVTSLTRYTQRQTTHDLTVSGMHTYYVGIGASNALVHNDDGCGDLSADEVKDARSKQVGEGDPKKFKDHYQRHKQLVGDALGKKYKKLKDDGPAFREDISKGIKDGTFDLVGKGTLKKGEPEGLVYRGRGVTIVLRENGDFWTALKSGEGLDNGIEITKKMPKPKG
ncbi:polymorphic toxin-type HINT domain-containing protein [Streptomyces sp. YIM 130001]|uniref:polymorphic toxin-type HINT domain-containing protein n=1 Tax=Streptomyces sp. YIM 130001 TaxID=2259644 RepID=UPI0013C443BC|nr:polymorphic toxin-type HINT domain-containing protein [Streptomyces sp. YIM 130001]